MASLQLATKARALQGSLANPVARLYRSVAKELPRVLTIYDLDIPLPTVRHQIQQLFRANSHIRDDRVLNMLVEKGYMDLEETLLQHKQRSHLLRLLTGSVIDGDGSTRKRVLPDSSIDEQFARA